MRYIVKCEIPASSLTLLVNIRRHPGVKVKDAYMGILLCLLSAPRKISKIMVHAKSRRLLCGRQEGVEQWTNTSLRVFSAFSNL